MFGFFKKKDVNRKKFERFVNLMDSMDDFNKSSNEVIFLKRQDFLNWYLRNQDLVREV